jgi:hypothetical protein
MHMNPPFTWTCEIEIDETWVADGFNLTHDRLDGILRAALPLARGGDIRVRIITAPDADEIRDAQGFKTASAAWLTLGKKIMDHGDDDLVAAWLVVRDRMQR